MSVESQVLADLKAEGGNKSKLMQKYSETQNTVLQMYGGNRTDVPVNDPENEFFKIQDKISFLGTLK